MMSSLRATIGFSLLLGLSGLPATAYAYVLPETILFEETNLRYYDPPPTTRETAARHAEQQRISEERRAREQAALNPQQSAPEETLHGSAPTQSAAEEQGTTAQDRRLERLLERIEDEQMRMRLHGAAPVQETLHRGAPLIDTGPATIASIATMLIAGAWTLRRTRRKGVVVGNERGQG